MLCKDSRFSFQGMSSFSHFLNYFKLTLYKILKLMCISDVCNSPIKNSFMYLFDAPLMLHI